ncbi:glyoxalase/bleomycin resistance/extradiol dioxygenase family protein [Peribacillus butanolivorans]|uniref:Glyoxalase/bleomycin resistance/extradiol dioxygenase family protein n=1 Tax=Peribacillus butanolivorans TaxID=421767 RepID=A0AAX0RS73_9BACI|nr:VOC family protein [Peribacillus butanolivorans]AXN38176.1 glyoxalase/bleomycin resistance/extradiol dioxygenase family protein [Peribacillus butanolivorans]PEJ34156.1 glyoxalase/bleomycin resistance/extradiol dioxygenase family protein [Peribacillus butanolivorans]
MGVQAEKIFVNLPVKDLNASIEFFTKVGFEFNEQMTNENATCVVISESIYVMLLVEDYFKTFTKREIPDTAKSTEAIVALSVKSKGEVDEIVNKALDAGGKPFNEAIDHGFMYGWSFQDIDGHLWEIFYMDESGFNQN